MLTGSVGGGGRNLPDDVRLVQQLLTAAGCYHGSVDGVCNQETLDAIRRFQSAFQSRPDGRVDIQGTTWTRLNQAAQSNGHDDAHHDAAVGRTAVVRQPVSAIDNAAITRWVTRDANEVRFVTRDGMPPHARAFIYRIPETARVVPVVRPYPTPLVPGGFDRTTADRVRFLDAIRTTVRSAGLNWDARVLMPLWANESNWDRSNFGNNIGNIKSQGSVYSPSFADLLATKQVSVTVPESIAVMVFGDRLASIDGYHAFASAMNYAQYAARVLGAYPGALAALTGGGIEGAGGLARALQSRPGHAYSPAPVESAIAMFRGSYRRSEAVIGAERYLR